MNMERARHLNVWHDASTLANHGHIACFHYHTKLCSTFPTKSPTNKAAGKENPFTASKQFKPPSPTPKTLKDATFEIYSQINTPSKKAFNISFSETQTKVPVLGLRRKPTNTE